VSMVWTNTVAIQVHREGGNHDAQARSPGSQRDLPRRRQRELSHRQGGACKQHGVRPNEVHVRRDWNSRRLKDSPSRPCDRAAWPMFRPLARAWNP
jgi:hypothetical protein